jgi:predicted PurR-regulated permease PerM
MKQGPDKQPVERRLQADNSHPKQAAWVGLLAALAVCLTVVVMVLVPFFSVILLAVVAAGMINPSYKRLVGALGGRRRLAGFIICSLLIVVLMVPLFVIAQKVS